MESKPKVNSMNEWIRAATISPKGDEKTILRNEVFPNLVKSLISKGVQIKSLIDVGADAGFVTELIRQNKSGNVLDTTAIDVNSHQSNILSASYGEVFFDGWADWHNKFPEKKSDLIISSHNLYYFNNPKQIVEQMGEHLNPEGRICLILENFDTGKLKMLQSVGVLHPDDVVVPNNDVVIINSRKFVEQLSEAFDVDEYYDIPITVSFNNFEEALSRCKEFFAGRSIPEQQIKSLLQSDLTQEPDGTYKWRRDSVLIMLKKRKYNPQSK
ncbi:MAG: methyltransferase domain-containing protein [Candidatus Paceibacterota bacterium]